MPWYAFINSTSDQWTNTNIDKVDIESHLITSLGGNVIWIKQIAPDGQPIGLSFQRYFNLYISAHPLYPYYQFCGSEEQLTAWRLCIGGNISDLVVIECNNILETFQMAKNLKHLETEISINNHMTGPIWDDTLPDWKAEYNKIRRDFFASMRHGDRYDTGYGPEYP